MMVCRWLNNKHHIFNKNNAAISSQSVFLLAVPKSIFKNNDSTVGSTANSKWLYLLHLKNAAWKWQYR